MAGSISKEDREFVETWENVSPASWGIVHLDPRGDLIDEIVNGRRMVKLTTEERIVTQDRILDEALDPFLNGSFRPVVVPDSVTVESNPNALSDEEIEKILNSSDVAFREWLSNIDSVATYRRMLEIADNSEISMKRFRELERRLEDVRGEVRISTNDPALRNFLSDRPNIGATGSEPSSGADNPRRSRGGMSSNYR